MSYDNPRIKENMSYLDIMVAMSEGNPGALSVLMQIMANADKIDPDSILGPLGAFCGLDVQDCYGSRIWMLYKDVCGESILHTLAALRAVQLGLVLPKILDKAIDGDRTLSKPTEWLTMVQTELPDFGKVT